MLLLASTDPEILIATIEAVVVLVKINPSKLHASGTLVAICHILLDYVLFMFLGWTKHY